jgi:hypothetical protein
MADIKEEKAQLRKLWEIDQQRYLTEIMAWDIQRLQDLKADGWRKAQVA